MLCMLCLLMNTIDWFALILLYLSGEGTAQYYPIIFFPIGIIGNILSFLVRKSVLNCFTLRGLNPLFHTSKQ